MLRNVLRIGFVLTFISLLGLTAFGQKKFDGYLRNFDDYNDLTTITSPTTITVFVAGGVDPGTTAEALTGSGGTLTSCSGHTITGNTVPLVSGYYCFNGTSASYDIQISSVKRRVVSDQNMTANGVYKLTDFGAQENSLDNTYVIKSAMAFIGSRSEPGGKLHVPNAVYKVFGGNALLPIVIPPGLTFEGTNGKVNLGSSRIQLAKGASTLFKIGNNTNRVTFRNMTILYYCETNCTNGIEGTKAILASGNDLPSQNFLASAISVIGFEECVSVLGADTTKDWQFGSARIENSSMVGTYALRVDSQNAEFQINNSVMNTATTSGAYHDEEASIRLDRAGPIEMYKVYGGTTLRDVNNKALAFVLVRGRAPGISMTDCESENTEYNLYYDYAPPANDVKHTVTLTHNYFGDLVVFKGNVILKSTNNSYASDSVQFWNSTKGGASTASEVYSTGDTFADITHKLEVCPEAAGQTATSYPAERPNGDFHRLSDSDITPVTGSLDKNVCRRDFYLYNSSVDETNRVVVRTAQRSFSTGDSDSLPTTQFQGPVQIGRPPVFDTYVTTRLGKDRFRSWGYTLQRSNVDGALEFIGNQTPNNAGFPNYFDYHAPLYRFNGGLYPSVDNAYEMGNAAKRWSLVRGVVVTAGDAILSDKVTGEELYKIHEDKNFIYFDDIRTGKQLMRLGRDGNLYVAGKIVQNVGAAGGKSATKVKAKKINKRRR